MAIKKQCIICKQYKGRKQFGPDETKPDGKNQVCAECIKNIKSITPITQCIMPGCEKYRQVKYLCKRHFRMWCEHKLIHPLKGEYTKRGPKLKLVEQKPDVPDGRTKGKCKGCGEICRVNHWGYCRFCWSRKSSATAGDAWIFETPNKISEMKPIGGYM